MSKRNTFVAVFDKKTNKHFAKIAKRVKAAGIDPCKIILSVAPNREYSDKMFPYHLTLVVWDVWDNEKLDLLKTNIKLPKIKLQFDGLKISSSKLINAGHTIYFSAKPNTELNKLQSQIFNLIPSLEKYDPKNWSPHITFHIDENKEKFQTIMQEINNSTKPFTMTIKSLVLYEIYPPKELLQIN